MNNVDNCRLDITHDDECEFEDIKSDLLEEFEQGLDIASGFLSARQVQLKLLQIKKLIVLLQVLIKYQMYKIKQKNLKVLLQKMILIKLES